MLPLSDLELLRRLVAIDTTSSRTNRPLVDFLCDCSLQEDVLHCEIVFRMRLMTNFGFTDYDCVEELGINGKMVEVAAAMGLTSLDCMEEIIGVNRRNYAAYEAELAETPGVRFVK